MPNKRKSILSNNNESAPLKDSVGSIVRRMALTLAEKNSRNSFFSSLSREIAAWYPFDRLSINLYDSESEVLCFFTAAEGTVVSALSTLREASQNTVAGRVINSGKPVVISNLLAQFRGELAQPMTDAGLNCTLAFPLVERKKIIGTLHCSFAEEPPYFMELIDFFAELVPFVSIFLSHVLAQERLQIQSSFVLPSPMLGVSSQDAFLCDTDAMREVMSLVNTVTVLNVPIFINGETGTGKTMLAKYIHEHSPRSGYNFVKVNCPSIAPTLIESELFGHIRGAFTGAASNRIGRIEMARQGTLFLDEVAEMPIDMQSKLLQVIEEKAFERVGESTQTSVDFRLISATNQDIAKAVSENKLRRDFYYRLAAVNITLPPLRNRLDDIPALFEFLANRQAGSLGLPQLALPSKLMSELKNYSWPGNIRELRNVINRLLIQNMRHKLTLDSLRQAIAANSIELAPSGRSGMPEVGQWSSWASSQASQPLAEEATEEALSTPASLELRQINSEKNSSLEEVERQHIRQVIQECKGVIAGPNGAATKLGMPRSTLQHRMRKLGI